MSGIIFLQMCYEIATSIKFSTAILNTISKYISLTKLFGRHSGELSLPYLSLYWQVLMHHLLTYVSSDISETESLTEPSPCILCQIKSHSLLIEMTTMYIIITSLTLPWGSRWVTTQDYYVHTSYIFNLARWMKEQWTILREFNKAKYNCRQLWWVILFYFMTINGDMLLFTGWLKEMMLWFEQLMQQQIITRLITTAHMVFFTKLNFHKFYLYH